MSRAEEELQRLIRYGRQLGDTRDALIQQGDKAGARELLARIEDTQDQERDLRQYLRAIR